MGLRFQDYERANRLLEEVARVSGMPIEAAGFEGSLSYLDRVLEQAETLLITGRSRLLTQESLREQELLFIEVRSMRNTLLTKELSRRNDQFQNLHNVLDQARTITSLAGLVDAMPKYVVELGFVRALLSNASEGRWLGVSAASINGEMESARLLEAGQAEPLQLLDEVFEGEVVKFGKTIFKRGVKGNQRIHPELGRVTESNAFISAPIKAQSRVVAFVNVDINSKTGALDEIDRDQLTVFTTAMSLIFDRLLAEDNLRRELSSEPGRNSPDLLDRGLTTRELEVLELLAEGLTNRQIGEVLMISESTAISHVKRIMRKLGVANRTEAAGAFLRTNR